MNTMQTVIKTKTRVRVIPDQMPESPREWCNLGTLVCWHGRHILGDVQPTCGPTEFLRGIGDKAIILPLYLYDHSGITIRTSSFSCSWDSGQVGFVYVTHGRVREEYSFRRLSKKLRKIVEGVLVSEVETYDMFLQGDIWGFEIEKGETCGECGHGHWENEDSCYGFYGLDPDKSGMVDQAGGLYAEMLREAAERPSEWIEDTA